MSVYPYPEIARVQMWEYEQYDQTFWVAAYLENEARWQDWKKLSARMAARRLNSGLWR